MLLQYSIRHVFTIGPIEQSNWLRTVQYSITSRGVVPWKTHTRYNEVREKKNVLEREGFKGVKHAITPLNLQGKQI